MKNRFLLLVSFLLVWGFQAPLVAAESPAFNARSTRLYEIAVHRYVPGYVPGEILEQRYLLDSVDLLTPVETVTVPAGVTIPAEAFDKVLVHSSAWTGYRQLGPLAVANFELVNDLQPFEIAGRHQYEVHALENAKIDVGDLVNISTRSVATRTEKLVAGFVITDHPRRVLIRAVGPTLASMGVANPLADPFLTLYQRGGPIFFNGNWSERYDAAEIAAAATTTGAFPLPVGSKDAAFIVWLQPGVYSAQVEPETGEGGVALIEIYTLP